MLAYSRLTYPLKCAPRGIAGGYFTGYLNNRWWYNNALTSWIHYHELINSSVTSDYTYIEKSCFASFGDWFPPSMVMVNCIVVYTTYTTRASYMVGCIDATYALHLPEKERKSFYVRYACKNSRSNTFMEGIWIWPCLHFIVVQL